MRPAVFFLWLGAVPGLAQEDPRPAESPPSAAESEPAPIVAIPLSDVALRADDLAANVRRIEALLQPSFEVEAVESAIEDASVELTELRGKLDQIDPNRISQRILEDHRLAWTEFDTKLDGWGRDLQRRWEVLTHEREELERARVEWEATRANAIAAESPTEILALVDLQLQRIDATRVDAERRSDAVGSVLARVSQGREASARALDRLADVASEIRGRLWTRDAPPLWRLREVVESSDLRDSAVEAQIYWYQTLVEFISLRQGRFLFLLVFFLFFLLGASLARRSSRRWPSDDRSLDRARLVISYPLSAAIAFTVVAMVFTLDNTVGPVQDIVIVLAIIPILRLGVGLLPEPARDAVKLAIVLLVLNRLWTLAPDGSFLRRILLFAVTALALAAVVVVLRRWRRHPETHATGWWRCAWILAWISTCVLAGSFLATILGWSHLAQRLTDGVIESVFGAIGWTTMVSAIVALVPVAVRSPLGAIFPSFRRHDAMLARTVFLVSAPIAFFWWGRAALRRFQLLEPFYDRMSALLTASVSVGGLEVSAGRVVASILILAATWLFARLVRFLLREELLPRLRLPAGADHSVVSVANYVIWACGLLMSAAAGGLSGTQLTVVFGALGVGIGFGLQNIVSNFVSGLILIFERPIKVGDRVQTKDHFGVVTGIGIRASTIRTFDGAEVVVPNSDLVSKEFVNWTRTDMTRRVEVLVHVALGTDPRRVLEILTETARSHPKTLDTPAPSALMTGFGESALDFRLLLWTRIDDFLQVSSDLHVTVNEELGKAGIRIPYPQRDLHVHRDTESDQEAV